MSRVRKSHNALPRPPTALAICAMVFSRRRGASPQSCGVLMGARPRVSVAIPPSTIHTSPRQQISCPTPLGRCSGAKPDTLTLFSRKIIAVQSVVRCGREKIQRLRTKGDKKQFSIHRIDSKKGHTKDNIQLICWCCNRAEKNIF